MERELTVERTQAGLQAARKRGRVGGRPRVNKKSVEQALRLYESKDYSVAEITELTGVSKATLYRLAISKPVAFGYSSIRFSFSIYCLYAGHQISPPKIHGIRIFILISFPKAGKGI